MYIKKHKFTFDVSALSTWSQELADREDIIVKSILGGRSLSKIAFDKRMGITGQNQRLPTFETTTPAQAGTTCGFTTSGTTTLNQVTITTVPIKVQEQVCLQDLETYFAQQWLPKGTSMPDTFQILDIWTSRKLEQVGRNVERLIWQGNTAYTNDTWLKQANGFTQRIDAASDEVIATAQADITTSTVRGIFEDMIFAKFVKAVKDPVMVCGQDTFRILQNKLVTDDGRNFFPSSGEFDQFEMTYPGTNVKIIAVEGLNADNPVDTGSLPTAVQDRVHMFDPNNLIVGMNAEDGIDDFDVWYSKDDQVLKFSMRFHIGFAIKYTDQIVTYKNS